jgi:hypothetical protein
MPRETAKNAIKKNKGGKRQENGVFFSTFLAKGFRHGLPQKVVGGVFKLPLLLVEKCTKTPLKKLKKRKVPTYLI